MAARPKLSAVIVAWNSTDRLEPCIDALRASAGLAEAELDIVVVDNDSDDGSADLARRKDATVIENPINAGHGVAASQGLALAGGSWLMLVNPDLLVDEGFVGEILRFAEVVPRDVGALVPDIRFASARSIVECRGIQVDEIGAPAGIDTGRPASELREPMEVFGGSSGGCVLRTEALHAVGGLEPAFFAYLDDFDLAWRLNWAGYRALLVPRAVAYHEGSVSTGEGSWLKSFLVARNRRILFRLHGPHTVRARAWRAATELGHAVVATLGGAGTAPWRGRLASLRSRRYVRFVVRSRTLHDPQAATPRLASRVGFRDALRHKRIAGQHMRRKAGRY